MSQWKHTYTQVLLQVYTCNTHVHTHTHTCTHLCIDTHTCMHARTHAHTHTHTHTHTRTHTHLIGMMTLKRCESGASGTTHLLTWCFSWYIPASFLKPSRIFSFLNVRPKVGLLWNRLGIVYESLELLSSCWSALTELSSSTSTPISRICSPPTRLIVLEGEGNVSPCSTFCVCSLLAVAICRMLSSGLATMAPTEKRWIEALPVPIHSRFPKEVMVVMR